MRILKILGISRLHFSITALFSLFSFLHFLCSYLCLFACLSVFCTIGTNEANNDDDDDDDDDDT